MLVTVKSILIWWCFYARLWKKSWVRPFQDVKHNKKMNSKYSVGLSGRPVIFLHT